MSDPEYFDEGKAYFQKYNFFILGLSFTVLGFSIQTADLNQNLFRSFFEISSWILLLFSGITGLKTIKGMAAFFMLADISKDICKDLKKEVQVDEYIKRTKPTGQKVFKSQKKQYITLVIGFILIIIARGIIPIAIKIIHSF